MVYDSYEQISSDLTLNPHNRSSQSKVWHILIISVLLKLMDSSCTFITHSSHSYFIWCRSWWWTRAGDVTYDPPDGTFLPTLNFINM